MLIAISLAASALTVGTMPIVFPCKPGMVMTYRGRGKWEEGSGLSSVIRKKVAWRTRFLACSYSPTKAVAVVRGMPSDLAWYEPGEAPETYAIIQTPGGLFIQRISYSQGMNPATILPSADSQYVSFPVTAHTCAPSTGKHPGGFYCWVVDSVKHHGHRQEWDISYASMPDFTSMTIVPGVGITAYMYHHNGTVAEVNVRLVSTRK